MLVTGRGQAAGANTGAGAGTRAAQAVEAGDTMTDLFRPYLKYAPALRVVCKLRPPGSIPLPADYWLRHMVIVVAASYGFPDENEMQFSF